MQRETKSPEKGAEFLHGGSPRPWQVPKGWHSHCERKPCLGLLAFGGGQRRANVCATSFSCPGLGRDSKTQASSARKKGVLPAEVKTFALLALQLLDLQKTEGTCIEEALIMNGW